MSQDFDLPGAHFRVDRAFRARAHEALHLEYELGANSLGLGENLGPIGVENHLQQALSIAQIDKDDTAVVAPPVDPAANLDFLADERLVNLAAILCTHHDFSGKTLQKGRGMVRLGGAEGNPQERLQPRTIRA